VLVDLEGHVDVIVNVKEKQRERVTGDNLLKWKLQTRRGDGGRWGTRSTNFPSFSFPPLSSPVRERLMAPESGNNLLLPEMATVCPLFLQSTQRSAAVHVESALGLCSVIAMICCYIVFRSGLFIIVLHQFIA
jgi:hypothetical protein